jgi:hypothetical protein
VQEFLGHKDVKITMIYADVLNRGPRPELAAPSICTQVGMEGVILIDINNVGRPVNRAHVLEEL